MVTSDGREGWSGLTGETGLIKFDQYPFVFLVTLLFPSAHFLLGQKGERATILEHVGGDAEPRIYLAPPMSVFRSQVEGIPIGWWGNWVHGRHALRLHRSLVYEVDDV